MQYGLPSVVLGKTRYRFANTFAECLPLAVESRRMA
jgi:hypothetical protein